MEDNKVPVTIITDPKQRYDICKGCEHFFKPTRQCRECMCIMSIKTKVHEAVCPVGKW
jgi:hypothetical protein